MRAADLSARLAQDLVVVLVQPQHPGNVGGTARAMMNMGLRRLVLVDPSPAFDPERARWMAPGADEVLDAMRIEATLDAALQGVHRVIATTARHRRHQQVVHTPDEVARQFFDEPAGRVTALLFGREDMGLSREDTLRAESLLRIPTDRHASLNLAAAVLLTANHYFEEGRRRGAPAPGRMLAGRRSDRSTHSLEPTSPALAQADVTALEPALVELVALLQRVGYTKGTSPERVAVTLREALQRAGLTLRQTAAMRGMVKRVQYALDHPEIDWRMSRRQKEALASVTPQEE